MPPESPTDAAGATPGPSPASVPGGAERLVWMDGTLVPKAQAAVSVYDHGLLYGDGCFEGIRVYGGRIFKLRSHLERMYASAAKIRLEPALDIDACERAVRETVEANGLADAYIRLLFTRGVGTLGLNPFLCPRPGTIVIVDTIQLYPQELYEEGLAVIVARRPRIPIECLDPAIKSLNYLNNILAKIEAIDAGVYEAIMLNVDGWVAECTGDNLFVVKDGRIHTPPTDAGMLHGITRRFVMEEVAPACGFEVAEKMMHVDEVKAADEVFLTGTAAEIIGVTKIDDDPVAGGRPGPVTTRLVERFREIVRADAPED